MNNFAITVLKIGNISKRSETVFDISKKEWCKNNKVDYIEITEPDPNIMGFEKDIFMFQKYQCIDICKKFKYDRVMHLDYDIIINPNTPRKVFQITKDDEIGITHDAFGGTCENLFFKEHDTTNLFANCEIPQNCKFNWVTNKVQGGFLLVSQKCPDNFQFTKVDKEIKENIHNWGNEYVIDDQKYITYLLHKHRDIKFKNLSRRYNYLPSYYDCIRPLSWSHQCRDRYERYIKHLNLSTRLNSAFFIHYCGFRNRLELAEEDWKFFTGKTNNMKMFEELEWYRQNWETQIECYNNTKIILENYKNKDNIKNYR